MPVWGMLSLQQLIEWVTHWFGTNLFWRMHSSERRRDFSKELSHWLSFTIQLHFLDRPPSARNWMDLWQGSWPPRAALLIGTLIIIMTGCRDGAVVRALPPTNVARVRFPDLASYVVWVCWVSSLHREVFSGCSGFPSPQNHHLTWFLLIVNLSLQRPKLMLQR